MSSTDLDAPPLKLILAAIIIVVGLHLLTVVALVAIQTSEIKVESKKDTPPIEIEFISLPAETVASMEEVKTVAKEEPRPPVEEQQLPKPKAVVQPKPKTPAKPVVAEAKIQPKAAPKVPVKKQEIEDKPKETLVDPKIAETAANEQRKLIAAKAERAAQQTQAQAARDAQATRDAQAQAARDAKAAREAQAAKVAAEEKAAKEAAARAQADAKAKEAAALVKAQAAVSNTPVNFTVTNANWASQPNFSFPANAARRARSGDKLTVVLVLRVNKQGGIDNVRVAQSSGNKLLDEAAKKQASSGKFKPFTEAGVPVVGNATLPVDYIVP